MAPATESELEACISQSADKGAPIKIVGSGHSFSHLIADEDSSLISLQNHRGIMEINEAQKTVRVKAGTTIHELSRALWEKGWALENLGDIEEQAVGGALCTGTHGTGIRYPNLAGFVREMTLISPDRGREVFMREAPELQSLAVGTFAFGVATEYVLDIVPRYYLNLDMFPSTMAGFKDNFDQWVHHNRNAEIFWFPGTEATLIKLTNAQPSQDVEIQNRKSELVADYLENKLFGIMNVVNKTFPFTNSALRSFLKSVLPTTTKIDRSYKVYATERKVKFQETEWSIPISALWDVVAEMRSVVGKSEFRTLFPVEFRFVQKDQLHLSPSYGEEDRVYIAAHTYYKDLFHRKYFERLQTIFLRHGGRPHWGKMFSATQQEFSNMYPELAAVNELRAQFDHRKLLLTKTLQRSVFS